MKGSSGSGEWPQVLGSVRFDLPRNKYSWEILIHGYLDKGKIPKPPLRNIELWQIFLYQPGFQKQCLKLDSPAWDY